MTIRPGVLLVLAWASLGFSGSHNRILGQVHPMESRIIPLQAIASTGALFTAPLETSPIDSVVWGDGVTIGGGPDAPTFGRIKSVVWAGDDVAILDDQSHSVTVWDPVRGSLSSFGAQGDGPGEFKDPHILAALNPDTIIVADAARRVQVFGRGTNGHFSYVREFRLPFHIDGICRPAEGLFATGSTPEGGPVAHWLDDAGLVRRSGIHLYSSNNGAIDWLMSIGYQTCRPNGAFQIMPVGVPYLFSFDPAGGAVSAVRFPQFVPVGVKQLGGGHQIQFGGEVSHLVVSLQGVGERTVVQFAALDMIHRNPDDHDWLELLTFVVGAEEEQTHFLGTRLPKLEAWSERGAVWSRVDPFPEVLFVPGGGFGTGQNGLP